MSLGQRLQSLFVAGAAVVGLGMGLWLPVGPVAGRFVIPVLVVMLTAVFVQMDAAQVRAVRHARAVVGASLILNYAVTPFLAWVLGSTLLASQPDLRIGLLLLLVTPCTDWYLVFTAMARGHGGIAAALLPINIVLQVALLPLYVQLLGGTAAMVDTATLAEAVLVVLVVPLAVALVVRRASARRRGAEWRRARIVEPAGRLVLPLLCVAVLAMFASQARIVVEHLAAIAWLGVPLAVFFVTAPLLAVAAARLIGADAAQRATLVMVSTARNSPIALGIAVAAFGDRPLIAVALIIGPLVELPVLAVLAQIVRVREPAV